MGLQLAEQFGEENFKAYLLANSKWCKFLMIFCFCATGCCCCLCCCCCFNWCCGKCKPQAHEPYEYDDLAVKKIFFFFFSFFIILKKQNMRTNIYQCYFLFVVFRIIAMKLVIIIIIILILHFKQGSRFLYFIFIEL
jgi:hypothetical protein